MSAHHYCHKLLKMTRFAAANQLADMAHLFWLFDLECQSLGDEL